MRDGHSVGEQTTEPQVHVLFPWTTHIDYPKINYAAEIKWLGLGVNQVPFRVIILEKLTWNLIHLFSHPSSLNIRGIVHFRVIHMGSPWTGGLNVLSTTGRS